MPSPRTCLRGEIRKIGPAEWGGETEQWGERRCFRPACCVGRLSNRAASGRISSGFVKGRQEGEEEEATSVQDEKLGGSLFGWRNCDERALACTKPLIGTKKERVRAIKKEIKQLSVARARTLIQEHLLR